MKSYNPLDWYWIVGSDESRAWSSAARAYVTEWDAERVTRIANEVELYDVLSKVKCAGLAPQGPFPPSELRGVLLRIDAAATGDASDPAALTAVATSLEFTLPPLVA